MEDILADFHRVVLPRITHWNHPRFHAWFAVSASGPGILAELLTAALNVNAMLWRSCPAATELEQIVAAWVLQWLGLPSAWFGMIVDSGSTAVLQAMVAARQRARVGSLVAYVSEHTHSSVGKAAQILGIPTRRIETDGSFRIDPERLSRAVAEDKSRGLRPFFVAATVGTTSSAAVDPVGGIARVCREQDVWLHVDGAYGGAFGLLPECRELLDGVELADSFVLNAHKGLMVPLDCSLLYTARPSALRDGFATEASYLTSGVESLDFKDYGIALGRRFRALKLWFVLRYFGREGLAANLRESRRMAAWLAGRISRNARLELIAPPDFGLVCFQARQGGDATRELMRRIDASGRFLLSGTTLNGNPAIRVAVGNCRTCQADIEELWTAIEKEAPAILTSEF
jgi:aromatic-L-amino-acid decarboxylase